MTLAELRQRWEHRSDTFAQFGASVDGARLAAEVLADLEALEAAEADEALTLTDAARELEMHPDSIGRAIREGRLMNHGRKNAPRVKRGELAGIARRRSTSKSSGDPSTLRAITRDAIAAKLPRVERG